jgi:hypothetical protein
LKGRGPFALSLIQENRKRLQERGSISGNVPNKLITSGWVRPPDYPEFFV